MYNRDKKKRSGSTAARTIIIVMAMLFCYILPLAAQRIYQVGEEGRSTIFSFYNTSPECPNGSTIAYVRCINEPSGEEILAAAELWVCSRDLKQHRKVTDIAGTLAHNGVEAQWIDNNRIAFFDSGRVRLVNTDTGKDLLKREIKADGLGHNPFQNKILYNIYKNDGRGEPGIYELDCNTLQSRLILAVTACAKAKLPGYLQDGDAEPLSNWRALHTQYSPDGKKIAFRLDIGSSERSKLLGICNIDGTGIRVIPKPLHFFWYDNESIVGHFQNGPDGKRHPVPEHRFSLTKWDLNGHILQEMMTPRGNHLAMSPNKTQFVSETFYKTNPVIIKLYTIGKSETPVTIASFDPLGVTWDRRFHANPAFSRDGKRVYFSKPLDEKFNGTFYFEIE